MTLVSIPEEEWAVFQQEYEQLRENEELYRVALSLTNRAVSVIDIPNRTLDQPRSDGKYPGITESMPNVPESIIATGVIHPEDIDIYRSFFSYIYDGTPESNCTIRLKEKERGWVWYTLYARTMFDNRGRAFKAIVFSEDITSRKKAEMMYEQYYEIVTRDANYVWEIDLDDDLLVNEIKGGESLFRRNSETKYSEIVEAAFAVVSEEYRDQARDTFALENLLSTFNSALRQVSLECPIQPINSEQTLWVSVTAYMTAAPEGNMNAIICLRDISTRKQTEERLRKEAEEDPLTGLYNRKAFELHVDDLLANDRRTKSGYLFMIDIDDFKGYNDRYGHVFGDEVLQCVAQTLHECFRSDDILGRVGGDEFMTFVSNIDRGGTEIRAAVIGKRLNELDCAKKLNEPISLSIGIAKAEHEDSFTVLYDKADKALYRAKANGKGCWSIWE